MTHHPSSFRDPSGYIFENNNELFRQINPSYKDEYDYLINSGLYDELAGNNLLIQHTEQTSELLQTQDFYKIIKPTRIPFISYPYEWCFSQLKDAALLTLSIQKLAIQHGMSLKDATAFNIQFLNGKPVHIDTLSFERFFNKPWIAYRQFCQHYLAPLALYSHLNQPINKILMQYLDGIPLSIAVSMLPITKIFRKSLAIHLYLHAYLTNNNGTKSNYTTFNNNFNKNSILGLVESLMSAISSLNLHPRKTEWSSYYDDHISYSPASQESKSKIIQQIIETTTPKRVVDIGGNTGEFSRIASNFGALTISCDIDHLAVERNYLKSKEKNEANLTPLLIDITNPSPSLGWNNTERTSFKDRSSADLILVLALIHHLCIGSNISLSLLANYLKDIGQYIAIEFVPKSDPMVQNMLKNKTITHDDYNETNFVSVFSNYFELVSSKTIYGSERTIYLFKNVH